MANPEAPKTIVDVADKTVTQLSDGIKQLSHAFETMAPQAWHILVAKNRLAGWCDVAIFAICLLMSFVLVPKFIKSLSESIRHDDMCDGDSSKIETSVGFFIRTILIGVIGAVCIIASLIYGFNLPESIQHIVVPEYFAGHEIFSTLNR